MNLKEELTTASFRFLNTYPHRSLTAHLSLLLLMEDIREMLFSQNAENKSLEYATATDTSVTHQLHQRPKKMCGRKVRVILRARGPEHLLVNRLP